MVSVTVAVNWSFMEQLGGAAEVRVSLGGLHPVLFPGMLWLDGGVRLVGV